MLPPLPAVGSLYMYDALHHMKIYIVIIVNMVIKHSRDCLPVKRRQRREPSATRAEKRMVLVFVGRLDPSSSCGRYVMMYVCKSTVHSC